jgi:hypothetical protein
MEYRWTEPRVIGGGEGLETGRGSMVAKGTTGMIGEFSRMNSMETP